MNFAGTCSSFLGLGAGIRVGLAFLLLNCGTSGGEASSGSGGAPGDSGLGGGMGIDAANADGRGSGGAPSGSGGTVSTGSGGLAGSDAMVGPGTGGSSTDGAAGSAGSGGSVGNGGAGGTAGSGGSTGVGGSTTDAGCANVGRVLLDLMRQATACTAGASGMCSSTVIGHCACPVVVARTDSQATQDYLAAYQAAVNAGCSGICPTQPDPAHPQCGQAPTGGMCQVQSGQGMGQADGMCVATF